MACGAMYLRIPISLVSDRLRWIPSEYGRESYLTAELLGLNAVSGVTIFENLCALSRSCSYQRKLFIQRQFLILTATSICVLSRASDHCNSKGHFLLLAPL